MQKSRTQGGQRGLGGEGLDDTTTSRYMCAQPFCNKVGFIQNRLTGNCPLTFYYFVERIFGIISLHYARLFFARRWATAFACQERAMAPFLAMTSRHTFLRPSAQAAATRRACCERQMARTRALNAVFPKAGRVWHRGKDRVACRQGCVSGCWVARHLAPRAIHCIMPPPQP